MLAWLMLVVSQDGPIASPEAGWPQWRGPRRDGVSTERGLLPAWPEGWPARTWSIDGLGQGWASPIVAGEPRTIFIAGDEGEDLVLRALDLDGRVKWRAKNGRSWTGSYPGARASAAYAKGRVFHLNAHGRLAAFDAASGRELWAVDILDRFGGVTPTWAISEGVLVDGDRVLVTPGGKKAFLAALDAATGATVWQGDPLPDADVQRTGYASPILLRLGGRRLVVTLALRCIVGADADSGKVLWTFGKTTRYDASASIPVWTPEGIFYELPLRGSGSVMLRPAEREGRWTVEKRWEHPLDACNGAAVFAGGHIYGSGYDFRKWHRLNAATGAEEGLWDGLARGTLIHADGRLYCLGETGSVALLTEDLVPVGRFTFAEGRRSDVWAHPVLADGRLYLRDHGRLDCYDVRAR
jgi:outer membrane protein assembly factor BamB